LKNLLNFIQSNDAISTLKSKINHKHKVLAPSEVKCPSCNERNFADPLLHLNVFLLQELSFAAYVFVCLWRTEIVQPVSAAHTFDPVVFLICLPAVFPQLTNYRLRILRFLVILNTSFIDFFCILWPCRPEVLELFILSISLLFDFVSSLFLTLLALSVWKEKFVFFFLNSNILLVFSIFQWTSSKVWKQ